MYPATKGVGTVAEAVALVPGELFALGGIVPIDGRVSWFPADASGYAPLSAYVLIDGDCALIVDSGVPVHEEALLGQLRGLLPQGGSLALLLTRVVEFDSFGNAASVLRTFPVSHVYSQFPADDYVHYRARDDELERSNPTAWSPLRGGMSVGVGGPDRARREVETIDAPLRLLATTWVYDPELEALFTSDSFGHVAMPTAASPRVVEAGDDPTTLEEVKAHLLAKFDWLAIADTTPLRQQLASIFETREIGLVAPSHGRALVGRDVVARHYQLVQRALAELDAEDHDLVLDRS